MSLAIKTNKLMNILENIESQVNHIETLKTQVLQAKKIQLHSGMEGFESPEAFGVYKHTGGKPLGVVGSQFEPMNLQLFLDAIEHSVLNSGIDLDLTKLTYNEYYGGSKIAFRLPYKKYEIQSPMVGDTLETALEFRTGFDGKTKMSLGFYSLRLWCANGAKNWKKDVDLAMKNTQGNVSKIAYFTNEIVKAAAMTESHVQLLNNATLKSIKQADIDKFMTELTGYDVKEYNDLNTRKRNILDAINQSVAIEMQNTGANLFSLLQGVTRYTTHNLAGGDIESILYARANDLNTKAHELVFAELN
jgi:hypothetical protein